MFNLPNNANSAYGRASEQFPDPFCDVASMHMPSTMEDVLKWSEYVWLNQGTYSMAMNRVCAYFLTGIDLIGCADEQKERYLEFLEDKLNVISALRCGCLDFLCYGNSFSSMYVPFHRYLMCPICGLERPIRKTDYKFTGFKFLGTCPKCKTRGEFIRRDRKSRQEEDAKIMRWNPHQIKIQYHPFSGDTEYLWKIPTDLTQHIKGGVNFFIEKTPWEVIEAIKGNNLFRFHPGVVHHMREDTLSGIENRGWGIPRSLTNFKQAWYVQVLKRFNEAIALDYIVPFRVITPAAGNTKEGDPFLNMNLGSFSAQVMNMLAKRRRDPATWNVLPFPVDYRALGGEGVQLAPVELLNQGNEELLNAAGVPIDFFRGTLQTQAAPMALRLFQQTWPHLVSSANGWINWLLGTLRTVFNWERVSGKLKPVTLADDLERRQILLQLAAGRQISMSSAFEPWGLNLHDEIKKIYEEQKMLSEEEAEFGREQANEQALSSELAAAMGDTPQVSGQQGGSMFPGPQGAAPVSGGGTVMDMQAKAEEIAQRLVSMPEAPRKRELTLMRQSDTTLHALVKSMMEKLRNSARSQGGEILLQQGGTPPMGAAQ